MAYFDKLMVQGVRSFGPGESDRQQVRFDSPLTIIVGRNGCGKTTIIESLRYITTGEFPPGTKGTQFVHDPKIANETETKAQVRLKFNDIAAKPVTVTRNMQVVQKAKQTVFKTIESVISRLNSEGKAETSISSKCVDIDKEMVSCLGVSKAVLNNVVFCHQEESNWPLDDAKSVKSKFDEIFAASRYIKAIDELKKVRKQRSALARQYETEAGYLKANKEKFKELSEQKEESETKMQDLKNSIETIDDERQVVEAKCAEMGRQLKGINELTAKRDCLKSSCDEKKFRISDLKQSLRSMDVYFEGSDAALSDLIENHEAKLESRKRELTRLTRELSEQSEKLESTVSVIESHKVELNELKTEIALYEKDCANRDSFICKLAKDFTVEAMFTVPLDSSDIKRFKEEMTKHLKDLERNRESKSLMFVNQEKECQDSVDSCMLELSQVEQAITRETDELRNLETLKRQCQNQLAEAQKSGSKISELKRQVDRNKQKQSEHESSLDVKDLNSKREDLKLEIDLKERKYKDVSSELSVAYKNSAQLDAIKNLKATIEANETTNARIIGIREDDLVGIIGSLPESGIKAKVSKVIEAKTSELNQATKSVNEKNVQLQSMKYKKTTLSESLNSKVSEKVRIESEIDVPSSEYDREMQNLTESIKELQDKVGFLRGSSSVYSHYCAKLKEKSPKCPVCFRGFDAGSGASSKEAIDRLQELKNRVPASLKTEEQKLKTKEEKLKRMYNNKNLYVQLEALDKEIPLVRKEIETTSLEIAALVNIVEDEQQKVDFIQSDLSILQESMTDLSEFERNLEDLKDLKIKLRNEQSKLESSGKARDIEVIEAEKLELEFTLDENKSSLSVLNDNLENFAKFKSALQEETLRLEQKLLELSSVNQRADQITDKLKESNDKIDQLRRSVESNKKKLAPLKSNLEESKDKKADVLREKDAVMNKLSMRHSDTATKIKQISEITLKITSFGFEHKAAHLQKIQKKIDAAELQLRETKTVIAEKQGELDRVKSEVANEAVQRRAYDDNLSLRLMMQELNKLESDLKELNKLIDQSEEGVLKRDYERLLQRQDSLGREFYQAKGKQEELSCWAKQLDKQLSDPLYKEAKDKWVRMVAEWKANKLACADLDKFGKALDSALMRFHSVKMSEINEVLSQLWREVYTGGDIDTIEIRTEEGENSTHTRKTYNYRVVMIKEGVELDMRGRCSAGQKVLASLLIRLALAETFCMQCGVFSLDEPTTNLDRENIASLAEALVQIIRKRHKNSQFVIITHDMDFVELLGSAELVEFYHEVSRDESSGLSVVSRKHIREMEANN